MYVAHMRFYSAQIISLIETNVSHMSCILMNRSSECEVAATT